MKNERFLEDLEELTHHVGYTIRKEKGNFRGDSCVLEGKKLIMLNKNNPIEFNISLLAGFLAKKQLDHLYIKPALRKELEKVWRQKGISPISQFEVEQDNP